MLSNLAYATICLGIIVLNDNIENGADSQMIRDLRLDEEIFKKMIGKQFNKYKCDPFVFTNTVTGIVGLYIGKKVFELKNEQLTLKDHEHKVINDQECDLWLTRAIVFHLENCDIYFEKDNTAFSEEIEIKRGHDLLSEFPKRNDYFLDQWIKGIEVSVETEFIKIQHDKQKTH